MSHFLNFTKKYGGLARVLVAAASLFLLAGASALPVSATAPTIVSIQFDDGNADAYTARSILAAHGMHATYYVNSGTIGTSSHLSWAQLHDLANDGNEIASHTIFHTDVKKLKWADAVQAICGDRVNLTNQGFTITSFAYPFSDFDAQAEQVAAYCGDNSGRTSSGGTETIPPANSYATRTPNNPKQGTTVATIESYVTQAEQSSGGWVQLVFHHVCVQCDAYSITPTDFTTLLDWLQPRAANGTIVETTTQVIGGAVQPVHNP